MLLGFILSPAAPSTCMHKQVILSKHKQPFENHINKRSSAPPLTQSTDELSE